MFKLYHLLPALALLVVAPAVTQAQSYSSFCETEYKIQVQYEHWTSGGRYWATEYTTDNLAEAQLMLSLFEAADEAGQLDDILDVGWSYIIVDIKLVTKTTCNYPQLRVNPYFGNYAPRNYQLRTN